MTTLATEIVGLLSTVHSVGSIAKDAVEIAKWIDVSKALQTRFDESAQEVHREVAQVSHAVCRAMVAHALGRDPSHEDVTRFMAAAVNDPAFPYRAFRLMGEARKAASRRRRAFLAAMLFGLPFTKLPDDERDRIDMVVERIMTANVELLCLIVDKDRRTRPTSTGDEKYCFRDSNLVVLTHGLDVRTATTDDHWAGEFTDDVYSDSRFSRRGGTPPRVRRRPSRRRQGTR